MHTHSLKIWPRHYDAVSRGNKRFELRYDDRDYEVGDRVHYREFTPDADWAVTRRGEYTGRELIAEITYVLREDEESPEFVPDGWVVISILVLPNHS